MINRIDLRGTQPDTATLREVLPRGGVDIDSVLPTVHPIVEDVRIKGASAAVDYGTQFDGATPQSVLVPQEVMEQALEDLDPQVRKSLEIAISQVRSFHSAIKPEEKTIQVIPGGEVSQRWIPVERVGLYVPGGRAVYPSSVIMNVVPAQEAGVESLVIASPPQSEFHAWPHPTILAACVLLGVKEVWAVGGAQAIALLAHGDAQYVDPISGEFAPLEPVDLITGPGNIFVTAAKRLCRSVVGIDAEAGPTEIAILADDTADPVAVAYDLISQAEHDPMAASVLITSSEQLAQKVDEEVEKRYQLTLNHDRVREALTGVQSGIILVDSREMGIQVANAYAAEHLEIQTAQAQEDVAAIRHAGAIFIGHYSPVPLGDYAAGSNHVLPTSGSARYASGLSTHTFLKSVHVINYDKEALATISDTVIALADAEQLPAHGEAIKARAEREDL